MPDRQTLPRTERLRTLGVIRRLFSEGESRFVYPFRVVWLPDENTDNTEAPESAEASDNAGVPGSAEAPKTGEVSEITDAPKTVEVSEIADASDASRVSKASEAAGVSGTAAAVAVSRGTVSASRDTAHAPQLRVLFSVPKKYHKRANRRNLIRRRTKEAYRLQKSALHLHRPHDIALVYTSREVENYDRIAHAVRKIIALLNTLNR